MGVLDGLGRLFRPDPSPAPEAVADLTWVDEFIARVRPFIFVREEDNLLIKRPNQAQKLNEQGAKILGRLVDGTMERWGRVDAVVNSAGHGPKGPVLEITDEDWHDGMEVYLLNVVRMARLTTPIMQKQGAGSIVNISTYATFEPDATFPTSGVFRAGLAAFTKLFSDKYAADNIRMNNVLPGFIDSLPETEERRARIPMGRYGRAGEVSDLVAFLASDRSGYITGQNIRIDGGITRSV